MPYAVCQLLSDHGLERLENRFVSEKFFERGLAGSIFDRCVERNCAVEVQQLGDLETFHTRPRCELVEGRQRSAVLEGVVRNPTKP